jgi:hypothetical protein
MSTGKPRRYDYEYRCNGVANVFMMFEPLTGKRHVEVMERRSKKDWAYCIRELADEAYPDAGRIVLVTDHLNSHKKASLYAAFEPAEANVLRHFGPCWCE